MQVLITFMAWTSPEVNKTSLAVSDLRPQSVANILDVQEVLSANELQWSPPGTFHNLCWTILAALQTADQSLHNVTQASPRHTSLHAQHLTLCQACETTFESMRVRSPRIVCFLSRRTKD